MALLHDISSRPKLVKHKSLALLKIGLERRWLHWLESAALGHPLQAFATWFAECATTCSPASTRMLKRAELAKQTVLQLIFKILPNFEEKPSAEIDFDTILGHCTKTRFRGTASNYFQCPCKGLKDCTVEIGTSRSTKFLTCTTISNCVPPPQKAAGTGTQKSIEWTHGTYIYMYIYIYVYIYI